MKQNSYNGLKYYQGKLSAVTDVLATEEALQIIINGIPFTTTMRTPGDDVELVRGLLYSEDVLTDLQMELEVTIAPDLEKSGQAIARTEIPQHLLRPGYQTVRNIVSVSSCGICGKAELGHEGQKALHRPKEKLHIQNLGKMFVKMREQQELFSSSGGSHAAAAFGTDEALLSVKEDIGRHNAVDKVIGNLILHEKLEQAICLTLSGRVSYEIVQKCLKAGIPYLAAVSAPSSRAVEMAEEMGLTLMAFCREGRATLYTHPENISVNAHPGDFIKAKKLCQKT